MSAYQLYRETSLGSSLISSLDEFIDDGRISKELALKVLQQYDVSINRALAVMTRDRVTFRAEKLQSYRYIDNVWTFVVENMEVRNNRRTIDVGVVDQVKIVACDGTSQLMK